MGYAEATFRAYCDDALNCPPPPDDPHTLETAGYIVLAIIMVAGLISGAILLAVKVREVYVKKQGSNLGRGSRRSYPEGALLNPLAGLGRGSNSSAPNAHMRDYI